MRAAGQEILTLKSDRYEDTWAVWEARRYLVDEGLLSREAGVYWRTGGYVDV